jgi:alkylation response protein AidB-like acyl-CoA dehydrogenase
VAERVRDAGLVLLAADAFGAAWRLLRMTAAYTGTREQFGTRLAQFQAVKHQLAQRGHRARAVARSALVCRARGRSPARARARMPRRS